MRRGFDGNNRVVDLRDIYEKCPDRERYIQFLIHNTGNLCTQLHREPATFIKKLAELFDDRDFDDAVDVYKDGVILELAGVSNEEC